VKARNLKLLAKISQSLTLPRNDTHLSFQRTRAFVISTNAVRRNLIAANTVISQSLTLFWNDRTGIWIPSKLTWLNSYDFFKLMKDC